MNIEQLPVTARTEIENPFKIPKGGVVAARPHLNIAGGVQFVMKFPNGYGASVVRFKGSYGYEEGLWELAVVTHKNSEEPFGYELTYETPITDDVIGYLDESDVAGTLIEIAALPVKESKK